MSEKFENAKEAMDYLFGRSKAPRSRLDVQIAEALAKPSSGSPAKPPRKAAGGKPRASKSGSGSGSGSMTKAQYLAQLRPPLSLLGDDRVSRADVTKRIREEIAGAIRAGALPAGTQVSVSQPSGHKSINVRITKWSGPVFTNAYTEHLMDPKGTKWEEPPRSADHLGWDPRYTDELNRAIVFLEKLRERHNYDRSDSMTDYFDTGYYGDTSAGPVRDAAKMGIEQESNKEFADLLRRGHEAARAVGPKATKSICRTADLSRASQYCLEHLIRVAERAKGRPVEYDASRRGWFPVDESRASARKLTLGKTTYNIMAATKSDMALAGPRGATSSLVQNQKNPTLWAHVPFSNPNNVTWYRQNEDGTFTRI